MLHRFIANPVDYSRQQAFGAILVAVRGAHIFGSPATSQHKDSEEEEKYVFDDEGQASKKLKFVSQERRVLPRPPFYRPPIYFPEVTLQMMKISEEQKKQIHETGWTREVAFKTQPHVTKLEIKGILESIYGMQVERVHTLNYLGRKYITYSQDKRPRRLLWRAKDWKKAYVIFKPPPGLELHPDLSDQSVSRRKSTLLSEVEADNTKSPALGGRDNKKNISLRRPAIAVTAGPALASSGSAMMDQLLRAKGIPIIADDEPHRNKGKIKPNVIDSAEDSK
ncbi:hypothetical protein CEUSTIGMA_g880.t1 [Chlamydomonas eustigma]|uniref:Large ribosomal subunit protein uL23c n=1 Tax=Chlamydomonas eustigma TaxID=1157962 RepID=A0A250WRH5_9CHLO|nr:hypothetical protein CEUSTIGMA_g880.t1 [Chlamydomonas eustigma]|eukprot:GAX73428.1 hypothetical protein CEUSTIGMA_g880.t1 [Chlamydomonas eustigma]